MNTPQPGHISRVRSSSFPSLIIGSFPGFGVQMEVELHLHKREREGGEHFLAEKRTKGGRIVIGPLKEVVKEELPVSGVTPEGEV
jgi:hypothetical protein